jgi:hypothetical protein
LAQECPEKPPQTDENLEVQVKGSADFLKRFIGKADFDTEVRKQTKEIYSKFPNAQEAYINSYMLYMFCTTLRDDKKMSTNEKVKTMREFMESLGIKQSEIIRLEQLATRDIPKPVEQSVVSTAQSTLQGWREVNPTTRVIMNLGNADNPKAELVFNNMIALFQRSGIAVEQRERAGMTLPRVPPLTVKSHPNSESQARGLITALSKYVQGDTRFLVDQQRVENEIELTFVGTPNFFADGRVLVE